MTTFPLAAAPTPSHFNHMNEPTSLTGKLLIAMPGMGDPRFEKSVVFLCEHSPEGTMGLIVNKTAGVNLHDLLGQLEIPLESGPYPQNVFFGGPVETARGFVLHSTDYSGQDGTLSVSQNFSMTATKDILQDIGAGNGPQKILIALGYAGWGPGQLEDELQQNAWLAVDADQSIVFEDEMSAKWKSALAKLGIDPLMLSAEGGRA